MSVRGSKNKIIINVAGACSIAIALLLYHNASKRLEAMETSYERCHLNEESLSAQLQVNLEYKIRLEKSLQQEKSDHAQTKEEYIRKLDDERQAKERDKLETNNKLSALKEQYNLVQHQYDSVQDNYEKLKEVKLSDDKEKRHLEEVIENLKKELNTLKEQKIKDADDWKLKLSSILSENSALQEQNRILLEKVEAYEKIKPSSSDLRLPNHLPLNEGFHKYNLNESQLHLPNMHKNGITPASALSKSSTAANKMERELFSSANSLLANISTPMINPQAVQNEDKVLVAPMPQPRQESSSMKDVNVFEVKENVGPKPEEAARDNHQNLGDPFHVGLKSPDLLNLFNHVPEVKSYRKQYRESEKNNHAGEVGDEDEAIVKNVPQNQMRHLGEGDFREQQLAANPVGNEIPRNPGYQYQAEDEGRKEEGEDDDDIDQMEYANVNDRNNEGKDNFLKPVIQMPFDGKHDSVMLQPK